VPGGTERDGEQHDGGGDDVSDAREDDATDTEPSAAGGARHAVSRLTQRLPDRVDDRGEERECESPEDEGCRVDEQRVVAGTCSFLAKEHAGEADADVVLAFVAGSDERAGVGDDGDAQAVGLGDHDQVCGEVAERSGVADYPVAGEFIDHPAESLARFEGMSHPVGSAGSRASCAASAGTRDGSGPR
jgi:hypothetical protein